MDKILHILTNLTTEIKELKEEQKEYRILDMKMKK